MPASRREFVLGMGALEALGFFSLDHNIPIERTMVDGTWVGELMLDVVGN